MHVTSEPLILLCHAGCCDPEVSELGKTLITYLTPLEACMVSAGTMENNPQGGGFKVSSNSGVSGSNI